MTLPIDESDVGESIRVMIVDDHPLYRNGVTALFEDAGGFEVVAQLDSGNDAVDQVAHARPALVVLDIQLPDRDGISTCSELIQRLPDISVVMLTQFASVELQRKAFQAGARGFVAKTSDPRVLHTAVVTVLAGGLFVDPLVEESRGLTSRELEMLTRLAHGESAVDIAKSLGMSYYTVQDHIERAKHKLRAVSRDGAIAEAARRGLV